MRPGIDIDTEEFARLQRKLNTIGRRLRESDAKIAARLGARLVHWGNEFRNQAILEMQQTMQDVTNPYKRGNKIHYPSLPGNPPAIDSGNLVGSLEYDVTQKPLELIFGAVRASRKSDKPYAVYLEDGTSKMEARPWLKPLIDENEGKMIASFAKDGFNVVNEILKGID